MISFFVTAALSLAALSAASEAGTSASKSEASASLAEASASEAGTFSVAVSNDGIVWKNIPVHTVKVDRVRECRHHAENASMAIFTISGAPCTRVRVTSLVPVHSLRVRPASGDVRTRTDADTLWLSLTKPITLSIEVNGDIYHNLHLIANQPYDKPEGRFSKVKGNSWLISKDGKTLVFPPGFHKLPDACLDANSGQRIYLSDGAWVEGGIRVRDVSNVHIYGPGILRPAGRGYGVEISRSSSVTVEGITTTQVPCGGSRDIVIRDVKCFTHYSWGDGLNIFASENVVQQGCFVRTSDDCITVYATRMGYAGNSKNISVSDMTLWADVAHPIFIGLHGAASYIADCKARGLYIGPDAASIASRCDTIGNLTFKNIDILEHNERQVDYQGCMAMAAGDNNVIRGVTFEDVRVDSIRQGSLLTLRVFHNEKYCQAPGKSISHVRFSNVSFCGGGELSVIEGYSPERTVSDIRFENLQIGGVHICDTMPGKPGWYKTSDMCRFLVGSYVDGLVFR